MSAGPSGEDRSPGCLSDSCDFLLACGEMLTLSGRYVSLKGDAAAGGGKGPLGRSSAWPLASAEGEASCCGALVAIETIIVFPNYVASASPQHFSYGTPAQEKKQYGGTLRRSETALPGDVRRPWQAVLLLVLFFEVVEFVEIDVFQLQLVGGRFHLLYELVYGPGDFDAVFIAGISVGFIYEKYGVKADYHA